MNKKLFGTLPTGESVYLYTLKGENTEVDIMSRGATIVRFVSFGIDIVGGFDTLDDYLRDRSYQGAVVGRVANRVENARFVMDGKEYKLTANSNGNCLHGGQDGFTFRLFGEKRYTENSVTLTYTSKDGEEGFPAELYLEVTYTLVGDTLIIDYTATPDEKTPIALTNHAYFNLNGFGGDVKGHSAIIYAEKYTEVDSRLIPTGPHPSVFGTPLDFTSRRVIGDAFAEDGFNGYDHNFILKPTRFEEFVGVKLGLCAEVFGNELKMSAYTDQPCMQLYTSGGLNGGPNFKGGIPKTPHSAFCLEAQTEQNALNKGETFYCKGETYRQTTAYRIEKL